MAGFDSATAILRAVSFALRGKRFARSRSAALRLSGLLPEELRKQAYRVSGAAEAVRPEMLASIDMRRIAAWTTGHYEDLPPQYPGVVIGSTNGAAAHLCAAAGIPWLPQTMLVPVRWSGNDPDLPARAAEFGARVAEPLLANNPDVVLHHMHDGNQDRLMIELMAYFRLKWLRLPPAYEEFLATRLMPGAPIVVVDCGLSWPVTRIGDRHVFQTGAYGGLQPREYLGDGPRVARFLADQGSPLRSFDAPAADDHAPEAEWGFEPALGAAIDRWAAAHGHPVHRITLADPHGLSAIVADMHRQWLLAAGMPADRLLVESYVLLDPIGVNQAGLVPFWTAFPAQDALRAVATYLRERRYQNVDVLLFPPGVRSAGIAEPGDWLRLRDYSGVVRLPATDMARYPSDFAALTAYSSAIPPGDRQLRVDVRKIIDRLGLGV